MGKIKAICISEEKGVQKHEVSSARLIEDFGIENDAHAGKWHRQVSLLSYEKIEEFRKEGAEVKFGDFGENIVVEGYDLQKLPVGTRFVCNDVVLELTQIGKECHTHCQIYHKMGRCIMPTEGVFTKVLKGGQIHVGDEILMQYPLEDRPFQMAVITLSDKGALGLRQDTSGPLIKSRMEELGYEVQEALLLPDDEFMLEKNLKRLADQRQLDLILTTGGTGFSPRDITPEATRKVADKDAPGIAEAIRAYSMQFTKRAMLSRGVAVIRKKTLIINLPGSQKAVAECLDCIQDQLPHALGLLRGTVNNCGR